jgi:Zn ribbon nucleic-acid-binding protein
MSKSTQIFQNTKATSILLNVKNAAKGQASMKMFFFIDGDKDTTTCVSCGYEFTMSYPCPNCHEESADNLIWDETEILVECKTCGTTYQPFGKKE